MHILSIEHCLTMRIVFTSQSHNRIEFEADSTGDNHFIAWWRTWVPSSVSIVDISHNLLRQPERGAIVPTVLLGGESVKWPELQRVDASHNSLWGSIFGAPPGEHYNFDLRFNNISSIVVGEGGKFSASAYMRQMTVIDWRNQLTPVQFKKQTTDAPYSSIDDALNSSIDFRTVDFLPRPNSFEQVEYPKGSGTTPFSCPLW
jgi:hypothetical protein